MPSSVVLERDLCAEAELGSAMASFIEYREAPLNDMPLPGDIRGAGLLLLLGLILLGPEGDDGVPVSGPATGYVNDLNYVG
jgi:hypothetical protein